MNLVPHAHSSASLAAVWLLAAIALTGCGSPAVSLVPSPAGAPMLAFHSDPLGNSGLYVTNADGSGVRLASPNLAGDPFARWSPDGRQLAALSGSSGAGRLLVADLESQAERVIQNERVSSFDWSRTATRSSTKRPPVGYGRCRSRQGQLQRNCGTAVTLRSGLQTAG